MKNKILLLIITFLLCCAWASIVPSSQPIAQRIRTVLERVGQYNKIDEEIKEDWDFLRTRIDRDALTVLKHENLLLQSPLFLTLQRVQSLIEELGRNHRICKEMNFNSTYGSQIVDSVNSLCMKLLAMKNDAEKCRRKSSVNENLLQKTMTYRCLRKNNRKHHWELVPAVNKVAQVYLNIHATELALLGCKESVDNND